MKYVFKKKGTKTLCTKTQDRSSRRTLLFKWIPRKFCARRMRLYSILSLNNIELALIM
jgi:hypothetical protein